MQVDEPVDVLRQRFIESGMSKLLVYKDGIDHIIGYVHGYELFRNPRSIRGVMRPVNFIPGTMPADAVLQMFIKQRTHVAVVVDEFGGTAGMLTMEDVVETIVGDIEDEHDIPEEVEERLGPNEFLFSARTEVAHLIEAHKLAIPESEEYDTLAGYILHTTSDIPDQGEVLELGPFRITIAQVLHGRVDLVRLEVIDAEAGLSSNEPGDRVFGSIGDPGSQAFEDSSKRLTIKEFSRSASARSLHPPIFAPLFKGKWLLLERSASAVAFCWCLVGGALVPVHPR